MKTLTLFISFFLLILSLHAQEKYYTKTGHIDFFSEAPLENITANNENVAAFIDVPTGEVQFAVLMKSFEFEKALMQEHFNENYVESHKFPKATFKGKIEDYSKELFSTDNQQKVTVSGDLTIHGVTKPLTAEATLEPDGDNYKGTTSFIVKPEEFDIKIPKAVRDNIAKEIEVNVNVNLQPLN